MEENVLDFLAIDIDWKSRINELKERELTGVVFYTDGGSRSVDFKVRAGYGIHTFFYNKDKPLGLGAFKLDYPTSYGYEPKKQVGKDDAVNIIKILNSYGHIGAKTSQVAELHAFIQAAQIFLETDLKDLVGVFALRTDSDYVVKGVNDHLHVWASNKWRKADGSPLANVTYWKKIYELVGRIEALGCGLDVVWVKGHATNYGNIIADQLATLGLYQDKPYKDEWVERADYMAASLEYCPLLIDSKLLYYPSHTNLRDGLYYHLIYSNNNNTDDINEVGRNLVDASIAFVATTNEQETLSYLYERCQILDEHISKTPKAIDLNLITKPNIQVEIEDENIKTMKLERDKKDITLKTTNDKSIITVLDPPRNSYFAQKHLEELIETYKRLVAGSDERIIETDITDLLFDKEVNGKGVTKYKFKVMESTSIDATAPIYKEAGVVDYDFILTFGLDLPRRRVFSNIKDLNPKVSIFTWYENEYISYFGTIIRIDDAFGVWTSEVSNSVLTGGLSP